MTDGENLVLTALKEDGRYLSDEAQIVSAQDAVSIKELFLFPHYLSEKEPRTLEDPAEAVQNRAHQPGSQSRPGIRRHHYLRARNPAFLSFSVLSDGRIERKPSRAIMSAEKIFVGNILKDYEIQNETAASLIQKFLFYLNRKGRDHVAFGLSWSRFSFCSRDAKGPAKTPTMFFLILLSLCTRSRK